MPTDKERLVALESDVQNLKDERKEIKKVVCSTIKHIIGAAITLVMAGIYHGWLLSEPTRKWLGDWISK